MKHPYGTQARHFNPRPLAGATYASGLSSFRPNISIHAPLRGRPERLPDDSDLWLFQSTPPCGGDLIRSLFLFIKSYFNPRPLAGATAVNPARGIALRISIHAPLRGRRCFSFGCYARIRFQSTPPCGGDPAKDQPVGPDVLYFNPRPLAGATHQPIQFNVFRLISIHAPLRGRQEKHQHHLPDAGISIHAPLRGRPGS